MRSRWITTWSVLIAAAVGFALPADAADEVLPPVTSRFASDDVQEVPSFQRHVSPLFGRLGCNGRSCHGSFQGRGGFRLSLFGYDFKADHDALLDAKSPRVDASKPLESLILVKPTDADMHEGGKRYEKGGWEYHVFRRWIEAGAKYTSADRQKLVKLEVTPPEILFAKKGEKTQLRAIAVWPDGTREDVTCLCRFQSNSDQVATITEDGLATATDPGDTHLVVFYDNAVVPIPVIRPVSKQFGKNYPQVATPTKVDKLVVEKLSKLGIVPSDTCTDAEFLRRVSLDLTGTLPSATDAEAFLANPSPHKRAEKIEELLSTPAYAAWWTTKLCDYTGNNDTQLNNIGAVRGRPTQEWYDWIYKRVADNVPYDKLVEDIVLAQSRRPGQSYTEYCEEMSKLYHEDSDASFADRPQMPYFWARRNLRQPEERAIGFAYTFLGIRIQCAQCHKHPFDQWSKDDFDAFKTFFTRVTVSQNAARDSRAEYDKLIDELGIDKSLKGNQLQRELPKLLKEGKTVPFGEIYAVEPRSAPVRRGKGKNDKGRETAQVSARVLGGDDINLNDFADARKPLMDWLRRKDNPYFARAFVNRVWANYFNVGIVQPPDDLSLANPPSNQALLDYLTEGFIEHGYDMKWLHREICTSRTYQLSWQTNDTNAKDERNFSRAVPRRLPAEAAYDALTSATASDSKAAAMYGDLKGRAISIPGGNARSNNGGGNAGFALQVFGRSIRESNCDCDRSMDASLLQTVYLQNDSAVLSSINGGRDTWIDQISAKKNKVAGNDLDAVRKDLARMKARLDKVKKQKDKDQIKRTEQRIADLQKAERAAKEASQSDPGELSLNSSELIRQAYLRTLTRLPTPDEMNRCEQYLASAESPVEGAKGLLWTLINTKEFIVNH